jgi:hypothetical protein
VSENAVAAFVGALIFGSACWVLGWHYGVRTLRNRHQKLIDAMDDFAKISKGLPHQNGDTWYDGFRTGISTTLTAMEQFLEKFKE